MAKRKWADLAAWFYSEDKNEVERKVKAGGSGGGGNTAWVVDASPAFHCENFEYRKKERKFNEGEWYPTIDADGDKCVMIFEKSEFCLTKGEGHGEPAAGFSFIGESLGKLNFGGKDE